MRLHFFVRLLIVLLPLNVFGGHELSICAIFQNEAPYLKEWIEFHKLQGVEHFYLYNNNSTDHFADVLEPYIRSEEVTLTEWSHTYKPGYAHEWLGIQCGAYTHCIDHYGAQTKWLAAIDVDEFLFCPNGELLPSFFDRYRAFGGVCVHWLLFGTSHVETIPEGTLMIEMLTRCSLRDNYRNGRMKSIVQPKHVRYCNSAHTFIYKRKYFAVDVDGNAIASGVPRRPTHDKIRINHYWTRTEKHFRERKIPSRHQRRSEENEENLTAMADTYNVRSDFAIQRFVPALRSKMGKQ